jgi:hypothetical protein
MCLDHCNDGLPHHHNRHLTDWRRAWETSKVKPITIEPIDSLTITCLIDSVLDGLAIDEGPAIRPARTQKRQACRLMRHKTALDPHRASGSDSQPPFRLRAFDGRNGREHATS